ncbi:hypothetical protein [Dolichospermum phage Dfl-JY45]
MSLLNNIRPQRGASGTVSFFGVVKAFDISEKGQFVVVQVVNHDQSPGEERRVALNPESNYTQKNPKYDRPTIADLTKGKMKTEIGGTIRIENAYQDRNTGTWMARWISTALKSPEQGIVRVLGEARVGTLVTNPQTNKSYRALDILDSKNAKPVRTLGELDEAVKAAVTGVHGSAFIRIREFDAQGKADYEGIFVSGGGAADAAERAERVMSSKNENFSRLRDALAKSDVGPAMAVEVVPTFRVFFGSESATKSQLDALFCAHSQRENGEGPAYSKGFTTVLAHFHKYQDSNEVFCAGALTTGSNATFSRVGASFEVEGVVAGAENIDTAESGLSGAAPSEDELPPEIDLDAAMGAAAPPAARPAAPGPSF